MVNEQQSQAQEKIEQPIWKRWWFWILIFGIIFVLSVGGGEKKKTQPEITQPTQEQLTQPKAELSPEVVSSKIIFDIPLLATKSFSEIRTILGEPNKFRPPTDFDTGWAEWSKEGITLSINYDKNGKLVNQLGYAMSIFPSKFGVIIPEDELRKVCNLIGKNYPFQITKELTKDGKVWALNIILPETKKLEGGWKTIKVYQGKGSQELGLFIIPQQEYRFKMTWKNIPSDFYDERWGIWECEPPNTYSACTLMIPAGVEIAKPIFRLSPENPYLKVEVDNSTSWVIEIQEIVF